MSDGMTPKGPRQSRAERLEAQLRANLKRRKDQARSRAREPDDADVDNTGAEAAGAAVPHGRDGQ